MYTCTYVFTDLLSMAGWSDSVEYETLVRCQDKLVADFKLNPLRISDALVSTGLVPPSIVQQVSELATMEQKARRLVECVFDMVKISHRQFYRFITVLYRCDWLVDLIDILNSTHSKFMLTKWLQCVP